MSTRGGRGGYQQSRGGGSQNGKPNNKQVQQTHTTSSSTSSAPVKSSYGVTTSAPPAQQPKSISIPLSLPSTSTPAPGADVIPLQSSTPIAKNSAWNKPPVIPNVVPGPKSPRGNTQTPSNGSDTANTSTSSVPSADTKTPTSNTPSISSQTQNKSNTQTTPSSVAPSNQPQTSTVQAPTNTPNTTNVQPTNITTAPKPTAQQPNATGSMTPASGNYTFARTQSAPPNLEEQARASYSNPNVGGGVPVPIPHYPAHSNASYGIRGGQFIPPNYYSFIPSTTMMQPGMAPFVMARPQQMAIPPPAPTLPSTPRTKNIIAIFDPETNTQINATPATTTPTTPPKPVPSAVYQGPVNPIAPMSPAPYGFAPELSNIVTTPPAKKIIDIVDPNAPSAPVTPSKESEAKKAEEKKPEEKKPEEKKETAAPSTASTSTVVTAPPKLSRKEVLKKADAGDYKAKDHDPFAPADKEEPKMEDTKKDDSSVLAAVEASAQSSTTVTEPQDPVDFEDEDSAEEDESDEEDVFMIRYGDDHWNPEATNRRMVYSSQFMLQFQNLLKCNEKLEGVDNEILAMIAEKREVPHQFLSRNDSFNRSGNYDRSQNSGYNKLRRSDSKNSPATGFKRTDSPRSQRRNQGNRNSPMPQRHLDPGVAPLVPTAGRWESSKYQDITEMENISRKITSNLNKITHDTFERLSKKILDMDKDAVIVELMIKLIFEKAILEPKFCDMYAELCKRLSEQTIEYGNTQDNKPITFKRLLLERCQTEFEQIQTKKEKAKTDADSEEPKEELSREKQLELEEKEFMNKKKMLGNITFIGELFKIGMLGERIMHECIKKLLIDIKEPTDDEIEALCKLMKGIGRKIDTEKSKPWIDTYFVRIKELSRNPSLGSRMRFLLENLIATRDNKWEERVVVVPTPAFKDDPKDSKPQGVGRGKNPLGRSGSNYQTDNRITRTSSQNANNDEWEEVSRGKGGQKYRAIAQNPSRNASQNVSDDQGTPKATFGGLGRGRSTNVSSNRFDIPKNSGKASSGALESPRKSQPANDDESFEEEAEGMSEDLDRKLEEIIKEYLNILDKEEAIECIQELDASSSHADMIYKMVHMALESSKEKDRENIKLLLSSASSELHRGPFTQEQYTKGFQRLLEELVDLTVDIRKDVPKIVASMIGYLCIVGNFPISSLKDTIEGLHEAGADSAQFLTDMIQSIDKSGKIDQKTEIREFYASSGLSFMKLLPPNQQNNASIREFLEDKKLSTLLVDEMLDAMIKEGKSVEQIIKWVKDNKVDISIHEEENPSDIARRLTRTVLENVSSEAHQEDQPKALKKFSELFKCIYGTNTNMQVHTVFEIQNYSFSSKQTLREPQGTFKKYLNMLLDNKIIEKRAVDLWEKDTESTVPGKADALKEYKSK